jgi:hypothetical protein
MKKFLIVLFLFIGFSLSAQVIPLAEANNVNNNFTEIIFTEDVLSIPGEFEWQLPIGTYDSLIGSLELATKIDGYRVRWEIHRGEFVFIQRLGDNIDLAFLNFAQSYAFDFSVEEVVLFLENL